MNSVNITTWFGERELDFCPKHFVKTVTPVTTESKLWILERLTGRFYIQSHSNFLSPMKLNLPASQSRTMLYKTTEEVPYFENPAEATLYELTWS
jgi:hypothetical protein